MPDPKWFFSCKILKFLVIKSLDPDMDWICIETYADLQHWFGYGFDKKCSKRMPEES